MPCAPRCCERHGLDVAVVISDTMGRPWRNGLTDVALGAAGIPAIRDHRGEVDPYGNELSITQMAVVDELAAAGELVKGKCAQVPVAVVRGYLDAPLPAADGEGAAVLVRGADQDLFSLGTAEARADGLRAAARLSDHGQPPFPTLDEIDVEKALTRALATITPGAARDLRRRPAPRHRPLPHRVPTGGIRRRRRPRVNGRGRAPTPGRAGRRRARFHDGDHRGRSRAPRGGHGRLAYDVQGGPRSEWFSLIPLHRIEAVGWFPAAQDFLVVTVTTESCRCHRLRFNGG